MPAKKEPIPTAIDTESYNWDVIDDASHMYRRVMAQEMINGGPFDGKGAVGVAMECIRYARLLADTFIGVGLKDYKLGSTATTTKRMDEVEEAKARLQDNKGDKNEKRDK